MPVEEQYGNLITLGSPSGNQFEFLRKMNSIGLLYEQEFL